MQKAVEKLFGGEPLSFDQLIEYLPALKEVSRAQLDNWAKGAAVLHRYKKGETVCEEGDFGSTAFLSCRAVSTFSLIIRWHISEHARPSAFSGGAWRG